MFRDLVTSEEALRAIVGGEPSEVARRKELPALDVHCRAFIARSPFLLLGTSGADGRCDVSPKGDAPGFVLVLDDHHLVVPDRPGNNRIDGFTNIVENPHVGMIFLIPGREDTLRVNGRACIVRDGRILDRFEVQGKRPKVAIGVEVEECFLHCAKAFKRSGLWERERWPDVAGLPSMARMLWDQIEAKPAGHACVEDYERDQQERLRKTLY
jgi:PPOX class probable FMN-dependent enzyme